MKKSMWMILLLMAVLSTNAQVGKGLGGSSKSGYCTPAPSSVDGDGITNVTFSTVNNTTTAEAGNYGDYSNMIGDVQQSTTVPVAITYATWYTYDTKIWIDWNDDLDFADAGEEVYSGTSLEDDPTTLNASFTVPLTAVLGHHRMRIGGQDSGPCDPCYTGEYGSYEDYTINVTVAPTCVAPTALISSNVTTTTADIAWTGAVANYNVDYRIVGAATWTSTTTATNSISLTSLTPSSAYEVRAQKDCGSGDLSAWSLILTFNTPCVSITSFPYTENFEATTLPNCWTETRTPSSTYGWTSNASGYVGRGARFDSYNNASTNVSLLKTPVLDLTSLATAQMEFWWKNPTGGNFKVVLSTDGGATFPNTLADNLTAQSTWVLKNIDLSTYVATGNNIVIGFEGTSNWGSGDAYVYIDNLTIDAIPSCVAPTTLISSNVTSTTADIAWTGGVANYNVDYRIVGAATWTSTTTATNSISLTSLTPSSAYEVRAQKDCGSGSLSSWSATFNFNTLCASSAIPYSEGFESITADNQLPNCMQATNLGSMVYTYIAAQSYNRSARTGDKYLSFKYGANDWAFTPSFDLVAGTSYDFTFWYKSDGLSFDTLQVFTGNGQTATAMTTQVGANVLDITNTAYQKFTGTFVPVANGTFNFGIRVATSSDPWYLTIDDIALDLTPSCVAPTALAASNITSSSIDLSWTGTAANYRVQYRQTGAATWTYTDLIAATNTTISGLTPSQSYDFQVRSICSASDSSALTSVLVSNTTQIPATVPYSIDFESGATNWTIVNGTQPNYWVAGTATANGGTQSVYITNNGTTNDYDNTVSSVAHIYRDITFTPSTVGYTLTFDWKANGEGTTFDYDNLKVFLVDVATTPVAGTELTAGLVGEDWYNLQTAWQNDSISLPATLSGTTKRLVFSWVNDGSDGITPPAAIDNVSIVEATVVACAVPTALNATNITETTADLGWTSTAANFNVRYRTVGAATWTSTTASATTLALTSLTANTQYEFEVQAVCSATAGDTSAWAATVNFTTLAALSCATPTALAATNVAQTSADLGWTSTAANFNVRYRTVGAATWTSTTASATTLALTSLTANTQYEFQVQAVCSATVGDTSYWATAVTFTTLATPTCPDPTALVVSAINASGASLSWTNGGTETAWNIRYKKSTDATYTNVNNTTTKPYVLTALSANTAYVWSVQAICSGTLNSGWATDNTFTTTVGVEDNALANLSVYSYNNQINVLNNGNTLVKEVVIYDMLGQQVGAYAINSNENILINTNLTVGNYLIKVVTEKQVMTKKLLVK